MVVGIIQLPNRKINRAKWRVEGFYMKRLFSWAKEKLIEFLKWLWAECKDWHTIALFGIVALSVSFPIWMGYILFFIFKWQWALWVATGLWAFWLLPGAPFFTVTITITLAIKKIYEKKQEKKERLEEGEENVADEKAEEAEDVAESKAKDDSENQ